MNILVGQLGSQYKGITFVRNVAQRNIAEDQLLSSTTMRTSRLACIAVLYKTECAHAQSRDMAVISFE
jgi:hypothetical protein